jgi:hypothetical protein
MPMQNISGELHQAGVIWREDFWSLGSVVEHEALPFVVNAQINRGIELSGVESVLYGIASCQQRAVLRTKQFWVVEFDPDFASDDGSAHFFFSFSESGGTDHVALSKSAADALVIELFGTSIAIANGVYAASWNVGQRNRLIVSVDGDTPSHNAWLNSTQILTANATAITVDEAEEFIIGNNQANNGGFDGTMYRVLFGNGTITLAEALSILE